jgi:hypothetical protein
MDSQSVLLIFAKAPVAGQVKTRLISDVGEQRATELYKEFLTITLETAEQASFSEIQLWVSGDINHPYIKYLKNTFHMTLHKQKGNDLGERMSCAFDSVFAIYSNAVLIGSDCPSLLSSDLNTAVDYLENEKDVVLGPAEDGGYYLIGMKKNKPELFLDVNWGKETVFSETCALIEKNNLNLGVLERRADIDRVSDLDSYFKMKNQLA